MKRIIFHLDLDAFFACCEIINNPKLMNEAFVIAGRTKHSVVSCASYPARKMGIKAGESIYMIQKHMPNLLIINGHYELYDRISMKFFSYLMKKYTNHCEIMSIDECFLDTTSLLKYDKSPTKLAKKIQDDIKQNLMLSVSIGIANNKFLAKMASDLHKPSGITTILNKDELQSKIWPLDIEKMYFIGKSASNRLKKIGIKTIKDLANFKNFKVLERYLNNNWYEIWKNANGIDVDYVNSNNNLPKSQSVNHTLLDPTNDIVEIEMILKNISKELETKLRYYHAFGDCISIIFKINNKSYIKSKKLKKLINGYEDLYEYAIDLLNINWNQNNLIQLLGIGLSDLQFSFNNVFLNNKKLDNVFNHIVQKVNKKMGKNLLCIANDKFTS